MRLVDKCLKCNHIFRHAVEGTKPGKFTSKEVCGAPLPNSQKYCQSKQFETLDEDAPPKAQDRSSFSSDVAARKALPICTGCLDYFPDALAAVAEVSRIGNEQHNPGEPLHWARGKSNDQEDALVRHLVDRGKRDTDGARHSAKVAWRALALLQLEIEAERGSK